MNESFLVKEENSPTCDAHVVSNGSDMDKMSWLKQIKCWVGKLKNFKIQWVNRNYLII